VLSRGYVVSLMCLLVADGVGLSNNARKKLMSTKSKSGMVAKSGDMFTVTDRSQKALTYKESVLVDILVKVYSVDRKEAESKCFGFGLDPRKSVGERMTSCYCGKASEDQCHRFPKGYTFAVKEKYADFC
jgi:hypothetical protein